MTVRDFIKQILEEAPDLDAIIYINTPVDDIEVQGFSITEITSEGNNDSLTIKIQAD